MRFLCLLVVLVVACGKDSNEQTGEPSEPKAEAKQAPSPAPAIEMSNVTMRDVVEKAIADAQAMAASKPPPPAPVPVDPLPPEEPATSPPTTPTTTTTTTTTAPAADELKVGDRVLARWTNGRWYPGKIVAIRDGKYDVNYDDGDRSRGLPASKVRKAPPRKSGGGVATRRNTSSSDAPCPGPGLTRRCNGKCVNIQTDSNHCGGCNNRCPAGKRCDGHMFCRDAAGNL